MSKRTSPLDVVRVAAPCETDWDNMMGTERVRFCGQCSLNVYHLSAMSQREAERLIPETELGARACRSCDKQAHRCPVVRARRAHTGEDARTFTAVIAV